MNKLKTIAMYLPQFHRTPENDEWWGEGFTEWTAVREAEKLFEGHNQTREPLNDYYYDLLNKDTMQWQTGLAKEYGIYGFCFYHYYFKDGRKVLEKPAENLLKWKDIDIPFCFCWANETWARTWSNIRSKNVWSSKFENRGVNSSEILLQQEYGKEKEWKEHFEYLMAFFQDDRYIKINNRPVFIIYKPDDIPVFGRMLAYWEKLAVQVGFSGLYSIAVNSFKHTEANAVLLQGPTAYRVRNIAGEEVEINRINRINNIDYEETWKNAVQNIAPDRCRVYYGGFVDYDDTPRRGEAGWLMKDASPEVFEKYAYQLAVKNLVNGNEFYFINAWNEWGEGNYLEPDKKYGYEYLKALKRINDECNSKEFDPVKEWNIILQQSKRSWEDREKKWFNEVERYQKCFQILNQWLLLKERNIELANYFLNNRYKKVIIYGFAAIGRHLYEELKDTALEIVCVIDRRGDLKVPGLTIIAPEDTIPVSDVIVVTVVQGGNEIAKELQMKTDRPVITLWDIIFGEDGHSFEKVR